MFDCSTRLDGRGVQARTIAGGVFTTTVQASGSYARGTSLPLMLACTMSAPRCFLARPRQVSKPLTPEAPLFLDLTAFHAAEVSLADKKAVV
ncbi:uncharacterized protein ATNIH1004_011697 [Aspergillus tanneri]|uniref:Uncharacterized protein n=1 Tax=Aspergillus tanneri TaxID=1220188 RepID=A0A5M9M4C0_9EURO|nr:uncharacterized protein ATNIH1004_011697 [Aspergillus tanneri]KAA8641561.1 hypothetical protein ATNIH1004_011697 [Aspergillus tanneri]